MPQKACRCRTQWSLTAFLSDVHTEVCSGETVDQQRSAPCEWISVGKINLDPTSHIHNVVSCGMHFRHKINSAMTRLPEGNMEYPQV